MNLKKYLRQRAESETEELSESDLQFCERLAEEQPLTCKARNNRINLWRGLSCGAAAAVLASAIIIPIAIVNKPSDEILYNEENVVTKISDLSELNDNSDYYIIERLDNIAYDVKLFYDSVSTDNLYYEVKYDYLIARCELYIVVNDNYTFNFSLAGDLHNESLLQYELFYCKGEVASFDGIETRYNGYVNYDNKRAYFSYTQTVDLGKQAFLDEIQSVLKVKDK